MDFTVSDFVKQVDLAAYNGPMGIFEDYDGVDSPFRHGAADESEEAERDLVVRETYDQNSYDELPY